MDILEQIEKYSLKFPNRIAYIINGEKMTYKELNDKSNSLASKIQETAKEDNTPIIVYGHKNKYMLICFLAAVKSGRAYCPVDISFPMERTMKVIETVNPKIILATEDLAIKDERIWNLNIIEENANKQNNINSINRVKKDDVFYIIFTSGSTGNPKGVQITLDCLNNFVKWSSNLVDFSNDDNLRFLNQAPFSFDLSVMDTYTSLATGGTLCAISKDNQLDIAKLFELLKNMDIDIWVSTPSFANMCLTFKEFNQELLPRLKKFLFCGEILPKLVAEKLIDRFEKASIINTYGPTESTVAVTSVEIDKNIINNNVVLPIGKEKIGTKIYIEDESGNELLEGEKGEIVILGNTVSIGYYKNKKKTEEVFSKRMYNNKEYRTYKTGDKGYFKNGNLYYCGRIDFQIKLHGYRIEIEDIENNLLKCDNVKAAAVVPLYEKDNITVKSLEAFVVSSKNIENEFYESKKIKENLKEFVPAYMVPKKIKFIREMPMTNNFKIDRKFLGRLKK